ncbi:hypothetical protein CEXT_397691 [Caerostris extrusa]|uniref:Uncharacterized protein n=1 Tax=Caerostris extrusa TaxID=172846 RepID=A0AAV4XT24_CAEEX|nr:hypothetical protein CEXT_397691 [Caerostris extrusa]
MGFHGKDNRSVLNSSEYDENIRHSQASDLLALCLVVRTFVIVIAKVVVAFRASVSKLMIADSIQRKTTFAKRSTTRKAKPSGRDRSHVEVQTMKTTTKEVDYIIENS